MLRPSLRLLSRRSGLIRAGSLSTERSSLSLQAKAAAARSMDEYLLCRFDVVFGDKVFITRNEAQHGIYSVTRVISVLGDLVSRFTSSPAQSPF
jgi:hypothetical protein